MNTLTAIRRFLPAMRGQGTRFAFAGSLLGVAALCEIVSVFVLADVIDGALDSHSVWDFARLAGLWLGLTAVSTAGDYFGQVVAVSVSEQVVLRLRDRLFAHVQRLHPVLHRRLGLGNLVSRHSSDLEAVEYLVGSGVMQIIIAIFNTVGLVIAAFLMSWQVAVVALAAVPMLWGVSSVFARRQMAVTRDERGANSDISDAVETALAGHETAVAYNQQKREHQVLHAHGLAWRAARLAQTRVEAGFGAVMGFGQVVVTLAIAVAGVWQVRQGHLSVGQLLALTGYLGLLYPKMQEIADARLAIASAVVSAERVAEILDLEPAEHDASDARDSSPTPGAALPVSLRSVSLQRGETTVLDEVSLDLRPGRIVALIGPSGVGKTSLASLLCRFEHPDSGTICLGDDDYDTLTGTHIRSLVTLLPQTPIIKGASAADNIAYGAPNADRAQIVRAAVIADADAFIRDLPDGYDTVLDDGGLTLSGGQRQRIAMARAMVRDTPVLILDEPTSGLDDASVSRILTPLRRIAQGRTTLLITHDRRVTAIADRVVELRDGHLRDRSPWVAPEDRIDDSAVSAERTENLAIAPFAGSLAEGTRLYVPALGGRRH
ncbi:MAG TPA: ABC transporter ATP-binding protein [Gordonia polyisoprenivorans]|uniref:ABC transporter ATP-binding protein n=1 Tax=Gordonia polyisoprenivorans TaxID=84595 RepID=UPI00037DAB47|nr:ABC transporter ATP-binding protein [Gordonia polyisoprenivorans]QUD80912.1 ABC transporter ATP-binding protein [Gordonia polyisoprenivorans]HCS58241.1 ABC transporter ATP-binding protein [Gordonia polyisoprenivorans]